MTVRKTPYETTACDGYVMKGIVDALERAYLRGALTPINGSQALELASSNLSDGEAIKPFAHPVVGEFDGRLRAVVDMRPFTRFDMRRHETELSNEAEGGNARLRARLTQLWIDQSPLMLRNVSQLPVTIFARWISENLRRRLALDPAEQYKISILAGIFYYSNFEMTGDMSEMDMLKMVRSVATPLKADLADVKSILDQTGLVSGLDDFCTKAKLVTGSVRLDALNKGLLITLLGNTFYGAHAAEIVAVSLEHPPTWIAILYTVATERSYKHSYLGDLMDNLTHKEVGQDFVRSVTSLAEHVS